MHYFRVSPYFKIKSIENGGYLTAYWNGTVLTTNELDIEKIGFQIWLITQNDKKIRNKKTSMLLTLKGIQGPVIVNEKKRGNKNKDETQLQLWDRLLIDELTTTTTTRKPINFDQSILLFFKSNYLSYYYNIFIVLN